MGWCAPVSQEVQLPLRCGCAQTLPANPPGTPSPAVGGLLGFSVASPYSTVLLCVGALKSFLQTSPRVPSVHLVPRDISCPGLPGSPLEPASWGACWALALSVERLG